ncbi:MAG: RidA family protein [Bacillota bacterium]
MGKTEKRLQELGITLPAPLDPGPYGFNFLAAARHNDLLYLSGNADLAFRGRVGDDLTVEEGYQAARGAALQCLAVMQRELGTLDRVRQVFKVLGFVNSAAGFVQQPKVMNGCSDLLIQVLGDRGRHARSAVGVLALPMNIAVEVEMLVVVETG